MHATSVLTDRRYLDHMPGEYHPESPQRLERIYRMLKDADISGRFTEVRPRAATREELALNHSVEYVERIEKTAGKAHTMLDPDTHTSAGSWEAAIHEAGGVLVSLDMIMEGRFNNGFALVRPPGHHAEASRAMGFCLFNNIAIGAHYLIQKYHLERLLIVDWDLHHGNGTQNSFSDLPQGWAGKPHALYQASAAARGEWLCFIDADTFLSPPALSSCYTKALETQAGMFTIMTFQILGSFWERVVMPLVMTALSVGFSPRKVNDPNRKDAIANGQFILIRRSVYDAIGGHGSVRDQIVEDKAISEQVKWNGHRLIVADGQAVAKTRMYTSLPEMWEGWTKTIYLGGAVPEQ